LEKQMNNEIAFREDSPVNTISNSFIVSPFVEGELCDSLSEKTFDIISPFSGKCLLSIPHGSKGDVDHAVCSARGAFEDGRWRDAPPSIKKKTLYKFADLIEAEASLLDAMDAEEMGKPISLVYANANMAAGMVRFYAEAVDKITGDVYTSDKTTLVLQQRVPRGVIAAIVPWNFPTTNTILKVAPAIAGGNSVVVKPSEMASRSAIRLAQLALDAGLPPGVFNVVPGLGETVGKALGLHMDVDMVAFTGSTVVGKLMQQYAGQSNMKVVLTECGGKSPQVVFADGVDLDAAADGIASSILTNQGQLCVTGSRLLVHKQIEAALIEKIIERFSRTIAGDPLDSKTTFGPLVSAKQCNRVKGYIAIGLKEGGEQVTYNDHQIRSAGGNFVAPILIRNVRADATIAQEEIFGPVLSVIGFQDEAEAVAIANNTKYGLTANVWTADLATGMRVAKGVRSSVFINATAPSGEGAGHATSTEPFGQSGTGAEGGVAGLESYLHRKLVWFNHG